MRECPDDRATATPTDAELAQRRAADVHALAHESRNALQRSQACLEMLALEVQDRPKALDLIHRIQIAQDHLAQLFEEIRRCAGPVVGRGPENPTDALA